MIDSFKNWLLKTEGATDTGQVATYARPVIFRNNFIKLL